MRGQVIVVVVLDGEGLTVIFTLVQVVRVGGVLHPAVALIIHHGTMILEGILGVAIEVVQGGPFYPLMLLPLLPCRVIDRPIWISVSTCFLSTPGTLYLLSFLFITRSVNLVLLVSVIHGLLIRLLLLKFLNSLKSLHSQLLFFLLKQHL